MKDQLTENRVQTETAKISAKKAQVYYGDNHAIKDVDVEILDKTVTAFIGPSGCGKSTFLRCLNRMNDTVASARVEGKILLDGQDIYDRRVDPVQLRARVGMVFQKPNPFPKSIYDNVAYGPRIHGLARTRADLDEIVEVSLRRAALWNEVKDRLSAPGTGLSGGQQQRLCIARAVAIGSSAEQGSSIRRTSGPVATARAMQSRCCWPPERPVPGVARRSFTSPQSAARRSELSTISSSSALLRASPWIFGP